MTAGELVALGVSAIWLLAEGELTAPSSPESPLGEAPELALGEGVAVTVTVVWATVTVTGTQPPDSPAAETPDGRDPPAEDGVEIVTYLVDVLVPVNVVVNSP